MASRPTYEELKQRVRELEREALERRKVGASLRQSAEKFRNIYNRVQVGIFRTRLSDGRVLECNDRFAKTYGFDSREECMKDCLVAEHYVDTGIREKMITELIESGELNDFEARFYRKDGKIVWVRFSARPFPEEGFLEGFGYDITREKEAEEALRENEERFRILIENMAEGIVLKDASDRYVHWNRKASEVFGIGIDELEGQTTDRFKQQIIREDGSVFQKDDLPSIHTLRTGEPCENIVMGIISDTEDTVWLKVNTRPYFKTGSDRPSAVIISFSDITERKKAEEALRESAERFHVAKEASLDSFLTFRAERNDQGEIVDFIFTDMNTNAEQMLQLTREHLIGERMCEKLPINRTGGFFEKYVKVIESGVPLEEEFRLPDTHVPAAWYYHQVVKLADGIAIFHRDITERKQVEMAIRKSEEEHSYILKTAMDGFWLADHTGRLIEVNETYCQMSGYTEQELLSMSIWEVEANEDANDVALHAQKIISIGEDRFGTIHRRKDGTCFDVEVSVQYSLMDGGRFICFLRDITDKKKSEAEVRLHSMVLDQIKDHVTITDMNGVIAYVNEATVNNMGYPKETLIGQCTETYGEDPKRGASQREILDKTLAEGAWRGEVVNYSADGSERIFDCRTQLVYDDQGTPVALCGISTDVTAQKVLESKLRQAQKMEAIGNLAGGIAHDFNNILSPVMVYTEMALMDLPDGSPVQNSLKQIYKAGERARDLVKQILTFARKREGTRTQIRISPILKEAIKFLRSTIPTTIDIQSNVNCSQDMVLGDPTELNQVVMNLCTNAAHSMEEKGGVIEVVIENEEIHGDSALGSHDLRPGTYLKLTVRDTGHGIEPQLLNKVFEPYFTTKETGKGTGMGLAIVHGIVKSYDGVTTVHSELGKGTTFNVYLPLIEEDPDAPESILGSRQVPKGNERILLVDDEESIVTATQMILERLGYRVTTRTSSIEALEAFRNHPDGFDLVITDMTMPNMTGKELAMELMAIQPDIPIILCTGYSQGIGEKRAKEMGIPGFIMKPIVTSQIANTIREVLDRK